MSTHDTTNELFFLSAELVNYTSQHIFLTGKAGTGKTTFLKFIREHTHKNIAVVAPTGVAAINAGGVTMHSFFNLPFEPFLPIRQFGAGPVANKNNLFSKIQLSRTKREVIEELELLVIDEVSMLRCDKLDAIDTILRGIRRNNIPFGGVQMLFIGDLYQLPPVSTEEEWNILKEYYASPFFFDARVINEIPLSYVELKKIYRQKEQRFIDLLNNIRNNTVEASDLSLLHSRYDPTIAEFSGNKSITITTHNFKADQINSYELRKLESREYIFKGEIEGEFSDRALPTELNLNLKVGAQVMFIKNDSGEDKSYYNGKLAIIKLIEGDDIVVTMQEEDIDFTLKKETWQNIRYSLQKETGRIAEDVLGTFKQYPVRLAWAITIHKSQGLTFDRVIIDAGRSFAAGQVYVALSRCTTLDGITLLSLIPPHVIAIDERIITFSRNENAMETLQETLGKEKRIFLASKMMKAFQFSKVIATLEEYEFYLVEKNIPSKETIIKMAKALTQQAKELQVVAEKFCAQLKIILAGEEEDNTLLKERTSKAILWFADVYKNNILLPLYNHMESIKKVGKIRQYSKFTQETYQFCEQHLFRLLQLEYDNIRFIEDQQLALTFLPSGNIATTNKQSGNGKRTTKGETQNISLQLFKAGNSIEKIAHQRSFAVSTIETHLASFIPTGEIDVLELMTAIQYNKIITAANTLNTNETTPIKLQLGTAFSYGMIRAAILAREREMQENQQSFIVESDDKVV